MASKRLAILEREFFRSARGPTPGDIDTWHLIFDETDANLLVRHEWRTERHSGVDDFTVAEFLLSEGAARDACPARRPVWSGRNGPKCRNSR